MGKSRLCWVRRKPRGRDGEDQKDRGASARVRRGSDHGTSLEIFSIDSKTPLISALERSFQAPKRVFKKNKASQAGHKT
jgi:hypothetical protein